MQKLRSPETFICVFSMVFILNFNLLWSQLSGWLIKIDDQAQLTIQDFEEQFEASIDLQGIQQPFLAREDLESAKKNTKLKKLFLENVINDTLIYKDLKSRVLLNESEINKKVQQIMNIIKKGILKQIYLHKVHMTQSKDPDPEEVKSVYNQMKNDQRFQDVKSAQLYKMAKKQTIYNQLERNYLNALNTLRSQYQIKMREEYMTKIGL